MVIAFDVTSAITRFTNCCDSNTFDSFTVNSDIIIIICAINCSQVLTKMGSTQIILRQSQNSSKNFNHCSVFDSTGSKLYLCNIKLNLALPVSHPNKEIFKGLYYQVLQFIN